MTYAVAPPPQPSLPVAGSSDVFPVRRIYAVGRNYASHASETGLGGAAGPVPGFSLKPADSILANPTEIPYPPATEHLDPEVELVVAIGKGGADIAEGDAETHIFGYALGLDMIRRDIMHECLENQHSWDLCKSFDAASPCGPIRTVSDVGHPKTGHIGLSVNGDVRQAGDLGDMIWKPAEIIARLSRYSPLAAGDLIFTGTPKGPAPVFRGDKINSIIENIGELNSIIA